MEKAWAFYRRSTDKQELSIPDQRRDCQEFAARQGWQIVREFEPVKGWGSGLTIDQDPSFKEMVRLAEAADHGIRYLVVYDVSRFGRLQPEDKIYWERRLKKQGGIQVVYVKDDFKNDGSIGDILTKVVKHSEAHQFSMKLSELTLRGAKSHSALGHHAGGKAPYGYDRLLIDAIGNPVRVLAKGEWKESKLQRVILKPSPTEKPIVLDIFNAYDKGRGLHLIADNLNRRSVPSPRGRHWSKIQIHYMLRNRVYLGERIYNRRSYKGYRRGEKGSLYNTNEQWVIKADAHEPIIERELFERVQAKLRHWKARQPTLTRRRYLLTGLAVCQNCGYGLTGMKKESHKSLRHNAGSVKHEYFYYVCGGYQRIGKNFCRSINVPEAELEAHALTAIRSLIRTHEWKARLRSTIRAKIQDQYGEKTRDRVQSLRADQRKVEKELQNIVTFIKANGTAPSLTQEIAQLETKKADLSRFIAELEAMSAERPDPDQLVEDILDEAERFDQIWGEAVTNVQKKDFLRRFLYQVTVSRGDGKLLAHYTLRNIPQAENNTAGAAPLGNSGCELLSLSVPKVAGAGIYPQL